MQKQVDILEFSSSNQLAPLVWSKCMGVPITTRMYDAQAVLLRGKLYVRGGYSISLTPEVDNSKLYIYALAANTWDVMDTPVYWFALTTYHSQLVLVGGDDITAEEPILTNRLFARTLNEQWLETLPPLPTRCRLSLAVSFGDYLIVVGGWDDDKGWLGILQIFNGHQWIQTDSPPLPYYDIKSAILDGVLYLAPGREEEEQKVYYASLDSLLACCHSTDIILSCETTWRSLPIVPCKFSSLAVFGNRLVAIGRNTGGPSSPSAAIHAYSPRTRSWVHVANLSIGWYTTCCVIVHPLGDLFVVGGANLQLQVFKGQIEDVINSKKQGNSGEIEVEIKNDLKRILEHEEGDDLKEKVTDFTKKLCDHCQIEMLSKAENSEEKFATDAWNLRGVEVCGEMTVVVYSSHGQQITWPGYGLRLNIPKGCLPAGMEQCTINIKASLAGQYEFPENSHLVSAIFWLRCEDVHKKFTKPITVEIQHCAKSENITNLSFVRAVCRQKQLPYTFKQLAGGNFTSHCSYGVIELNSFSGVGIVQKGSDKRQYYSKIFFLDKYFGGHRIDLIITWDTEPHINVLRRHYNEEGTLAGPDQPVDFERDEIRLDIPMEETKINDNWTIVPLIDPVVTKYEVDSYLPGKRIPHCELAVHSIGESVTRLVYRLVLLGAKPPRNKFTLSYLPPAVPQVAEKALKPVTKKERGSKSAIPELKILLRELRRVAGEWEDIGIELDIEEAKLRQIKSDNTGECRACLREMLRAWLSRIAPPPSWSAVADALDTLGHQDIATRLRTS